MFSFSLKGDGIMLSLSIPSLVGEGDPEKLILTVDGEGDGIMLSLSAPSLVGEGVPKKLILTVDDEGDS